MVVDGSRHGPHLPDVTLCWYAAYGSNTDETRFRRYLDRCRLAAEPLDARPLVIDLPLYFAGTSTRTWGEGGVAFVGPDRDPAAGTLARAWLLPVERIAEVGAQENGLGLHEARLDLDAGDHVAFAGRSYDAWLACGDIDGHPVRTLTSSVTRIPRTPPSRTYVTVVARGLRLTHEMTPEAVAGYLGPRTNLPAATLVTWQREGPASSGAK